MARLYLVRDGSQDPDEPQDCSTTFPSGGNSTPSPPARCPLELNQLCGAPRETALLAAVRGGYTEVVALLLEHGADPNRIAKPLDEDSVNDEMYGCANSPLAEATRQTSVDILDLLLKYATLDRQNVCVTN